MERAIFALPEKQQYKDEYLDRLLTLLNSAREGTKWKPITYARLNLLLKKLGKSKKNWDRDIFIGSVLERGENGSKYFWWTINKK